MRQKNLVYVLFTAIITCVNFTSCHDDDSDYPEINVDNSELKTVLLNLGYNFNAAGQLIQDDKVKNTTTLDLSGTKIKDLSGLDVFPYLVELNLSNNEYGPVFDFSTLSKKITAVNLSDNEIYDFEGLVDAKVVNDEVVTTILHTFTKLYLPASAKWNVEDLMPFYTESNKLGASDMQMQDDKGKLQVYTTLRDIPDENFCNFLKSIFPGLFANETQVDISKPMGLTEVGVIWVDLNPEWGELKAIKSIEGIEYFVNNPYYNSIKVYVSDNVVPLTLSYLAPRKNIKALAFSSASTPKGLDLSKATGLSMFVTGNNEYLTELDLSGTLVGNVKFGDIDMFAPPMIQCHHCKNLRSIKFPDNAEGIFHTVSLGDLPALEKLDLKFVYAMENLYLMELPKCAITYPELKKAFSLAQVELYDLNNKNAYISLGLTKDVFDKPYAKDFVGKYYANLLPVNNDEGFDVVDWRK